jgi:prolipoprotein diacylglyceryl transferase
MILASIPSPGSDSIGIGPLEFRAYGLMIALGVVVAVGIARRRWARRGGDPDDISALALWAVPAGLVGARLYHVVTDWPRFEDRWSHIPAVWEGGLGIPGGLLAGVVAGVWVARRRGLPVARLLDTVAPAIPVAQAIGRLGNWFNQELYGRPTDLPWGLEIDASHRPDRFMDVATFHPTFLYEALWNLTLAAVLVVLGQRWTRRRDGQLFAVYVAGYALGRLWVEALRVDPATELAGVRVNLWVSGAALVAAIAVLVLRRRPAEPTGTSTNEGGELGRRGRPDLSGGGDDHQLAETAPAPVREAVTFGRPLADPAVAAPAADPVDDEPG